MFLATAHRVLIRHPVVMMRDQGGATAIEYAFIASLISIAILAGSRLIGSALDTTFSGVASNLT